MQIHPRAIIDHAALRHNLACVRRRAPDSRIWAVVKANGYGHGMVEMGTTLETADGLAVARVEEGVRLREAGITKPILVMEGFLFDDELAAARAHGFELALHRPEQVALLEQTRTTRPLRIWIKVDTGMHRLGFDPQQVPNLLARLSADPQVAGPVGLMTHLAKADDPHDRLTQLQCDRLRALDPAAHYPLSIGNSAGILACPASRTPWVRPGIMLYGASPLIGRTAAELRLRPVMRLATRLIAVRALRRGDAVGYGSTYVCPQDMLVGVAAIGYGDGYPRHAPIGTPVLVGGRRAPLIGRISMDMINIDLRGLPTARVGDPVTLWGADLPVDEIAQWAGTISYELLCRVTSRVRMEHREMHPMPHGGKRL
ncbi:alanine racemase [Candidatus Thiosymbion oneisti]|uniref:alanine racemase n=1 Tax=Candidatus Thiosymbion oneisti TaxID=589554 RepID=UPI000B0A5C35|nr:alanine racemase [Candidatus Thiosymbion oneisti]